MAMGSSSMVLTFTSDFGKTICPMGMEFSSGILFSSSKPLFGMGLFKDTLMNTFKTVSLLVSTQMDIE